MAGSDCPGCGSWSRRIHSSYLRFPADVPSGGRRVALCLRVRRFLCPVISCGRRTFAEQLPGLTRRYGRRTERLRSTLAAVGLALAGRAGAQTGGQLGTGAGEPLPSASAGPRLRRGSRRPWHGLAGAVATDRDVLRQSVSNCGSASGGADSP
ncbi:transposase family protein [Streptomyces agglomeratus]|uniref:transposase family protein n=1 Tax=Streptomyces agglomeratus TaxID=285458 RepID=UPI001F0AD2FA|nr:transposase family protein [Streptomyces agglomeratus]